MATIIVDLVSKINELVEELEHLRSKAGQSSPSSNSPTSLQRSPSVYRSQPLGSQEDPSFLQSATPVTARPVPDQGNPRESSVVPDTTRNQGFSATNDSPHASQSQISPFAQNLDHIELEGYQIRDLFEM